MSGRYDVAVIGGGPAGYMAAIKAAQLGGRVVLFERDVLGGTCLNRGCIPTKAYLKTAEALETIRHAGLRGVVNDPAAGVDMPAVAAYKNRAVKRLTDGVSTLLRTNGVEVVRGEAALRSESSVECVGKVYEAGSILLCGGSRPGTLPVEGANEDGVLSSDQLLALDHVPGRLAIIGGGVIGCEMAAAFHAFGSEITIIEAESRLLPLMDGEISKAMRTALENAGVSILTAQRVERFLREENQSVVIYGGGGRLEADCVLLSAGRVPDLTCLGVLKERIPTQRGRIVVDEAMRTGIRNIYAPGDVNGERMLAHAAFKMGEVAAVNAMGGCEKCDLRYVPGCVYTMPEAAGVGLTEEEAVRQYGADGVSVGRFPFAANGRAVACGETEGFVKVLVERTCAELLGVHIFGAAATEMIGEAASLMAMEITAEEAADMIHAHPTFSEAFMEACADALGRCIHLPGRTRGKQ